MHKYYVVLRRLFMEKDIVSIHDASEAVEFNWIDANGNRVWVVPSQDEKTATFVWGFDNLDVAILFYETLKGNEIGIATSEV